jgi:hypothetical protein
LDLSLSLSLFFFVPSPVYLSHQSLLTLTCLPLLSSLLGPRTLFCGVLAEHWVAHPVEPSA